MEPLAAGGTGLQAPRDAQPFAEVGGVPQPLASPPQHTPAMGGPPSLALLPGPCIHSPRRTLLHRRASPQVRSIQRKARRRRKPVISPLAEIHKKYFQCCHSYNKQQASSREGKRDGAMREKNTLSSFFSRVVSVALEKSGFPWASGGTFVSFLM